MNSLDGPKGVLGDEWFVIVRGAFKGRQRGSIARIAEGHADVAQQAAAFGSKHGRAGKTLAEPGFIQLKELAFYPSTGSEFYIALSRSGELPAGTELELLQQVDREQSLS